MESFCLNSDLLPPSNNTNNDEDILKYMLIQNKSKSFKSDKNLALSDQRPNSGQRKVIIDKLNSNSYTNKLGKY